MEIHEFQQWRETNTINKNTDQPSFMRAIPFELKQKFGTTNIMNLYDDMIRQLHELEMHGALTTSEEKFILGALLGIQAVIDKDSSFNRNYNPLFVENKSVN